MSFDSCPRGESEHRYREKKGSSTSGKVEQNKNQKKNTQTWKGVQGWRGDRYPARSNTEGVRDKLFVNIKPRKPSTAKFAKWSENIKKRKHTLLLSKKKKKKKSI